MNCHPNTKLNKAKDGIQLTNSVNRSPVQGLLHSQWGFPPTFPPKLTLEGLGHDHNIAQGKGALLHLASYNACAGRTNGRV